MADAQSSPAKRIGVLVIGNADAPSFQNELREGLRELGYVEGKEYVFELRSADGQLVVLHHKIRRTFLLNRLAQCGHLGSAAVIATIKR